METSDAAISSGQSASSKVLNLNQEFFYRNKKLNTNGIPKSINDMIMAPMKKDFMYKDHFMKAAPGLFKTPKFKNNHPLFILKLHCYLREEAENMEIYKRLTENVWEYIIQEIRRFSDPSNAERWETNILYIKKLNAFKNLLYYLRHETMPNKKNLNNIIETGIYGARKGKNKSRQSNIDQFAADYAQNNKEDDLEFRIKAEAEDMSGRQGLWHDALGDI